MKVPGSRPEIGIRVSDGLLVMERDGAAFVLDPVSDSAAAVRGLGRIGGSSARVVVRNGEELIRFMMYSFRKVGPKAAAAPE